MARGIETFKAYFKDHADKYIIIGGTALDIQMEDAGFTPRATKDIDIILVVEALDIDFVKAFLDWSQRKTEGHAECDKHIKKHKADIFRLTMLLPPDETVETPTNVKADLQKAAGIIAEQLPNKAILKNMGVPVAPLEVFKQFKQIFNLS